MDPFVKLFDTHSYFYSKKPVIYFKNEKLLVKTIIVLYSKHNFYFSLIFFKITK